MTVTLAFLVLVVLVTAAVWVTSSGHRSLHRRDDGPWTPRSEHPRSSGSR